MAKEDKEKQNRIVHRHSLISFLTTFSFVIVAVSGIMMFIVPPGRIASWKIRAANRCGVTGGFGFSTPVLIKRKRGKRRRIEGRIDKRLSP
jgi:hypothetical protein